MTTTYLYIEKLSGDKNIEVVRKLLKDAGFKPTTIREGEVKLGWNYLSRADVKIIKEMLHAKGFELNSVCQTTWASKPEGVNVL